MRLRDITAREDRIKDSNLKVEIGKYFASIIDTLDREVVDFETLDLELDDVDTDLAAVRKLLAERADAIASER